MLIGSSKQSRQVGKLANYRKTTYVGISSPLHLSLLVINIETQTTTEFIHLLFLFSWLITLSPNFQLRNISFYLFLFLFCFFRSVQLFYSNIFSEAGNAMLWNIWHLLSLTSLSFYCSLSRCRCCPLNRAAGRNVGKMSSRVNCTIVSALRDCETAVVEQQKKKQSAGETTVLICTYPVTSHVLSHLLIYIPVNRGHMVSSTQLSICNTWQSR